MNVHEFRAANNYLAVCELLDAGVVMLVSKRVELLFEF